MGIMLETSSDRLSRKGRPALRLAGQGAGGAAAHDRGRRPPGDPVHDRHPRRHRRDAPRARRVAVRDPLAAPEVPPRAGGHRPELPREAGHGDARRARAAGGRVPRRGRRRARPVRAAHEPAGAAEPVRPELPAADRRRHQRLGRRVAGDHRPREPRGAVAEARATCRGAPPSAGYTLRERLAIYPEYALRPDPWLAGKMQEPVRRLAGDDGLAVEGRAPEPVAVAGPRGRLEAADHRAHVREGRRRRAARRRRRRLRRLRRTPRRRGRGKRGPRGAPSAWTPTSGARCDGGRRPPRRPLGRGRALALFQAEGAGAGGALRASPTTSGGRRSATR